MSDRVTHVVIPHNCGMFVSITRLIERIRDRATTQRHHAARVNEDDDLGRAIHTVMADVLSAIADEVEHTLNNPV